MVLHSTRVGVIKLLLTHCAAATVAVTVDFKTGMDDCSRRGKGRAYGAMLEKTQKVPLLMSASCKEFK